jgi:two-component system response regulator AlgR
MKVLIVDDEPLARLRLRSLLDTLQDTPQAGFDLQVTAEAADAEEALQALRDQAADVVLLDIGMPGRDGLRLAQALLALPQPPAVVFVTAHAEHALRAFELEALDYLTKPVRLERLQAALQRVQQRLVQRRGAAPAAVADPVIVVSDRGRVLRLPVREVLYLKAEQKYVTLRTAERTHVLDDALSDLELRLGSGFLRIHRNALVALAAIRALELRGADSDGWAVRVAPVDEWLSVSRRQLAAVRAVIQSAVPAGKAG